MENEINIQENPPPYQAEDKRSFAEQFCGIHAGLHKGTVEDFLADCHADKERELAADRRREEERIRRRAKVKLSSLL